MAAPWQVLRASPAHLPCLLPPEYCQQWLTVSKVPLEGRTPGQVSFNRVGRQGFLEEIKLVCPFQYGHWIAVFCTLFYFFTSAQRLVWAAKQALGNAALGALFARQRALLAGGFGSLHTPGP